MSFRLVPKSVTLNDLERRNGVILRCFSEFGYLPGALRKSSRSLSHLLMSSCYFPYYGFGLYNFGWTVCSFWATVCKTVRPMLSDRCLSVLNGLSCL